MNSNVEGHITSSSKLFKSSKDLLVTGTTEFSPLQDKDADTAWTCTAGGCRMALKNQRPISVETKVRARNTTTFVFVFPVGF